MWYKLNIYDIWGTGAMYKDERCLIFDESGNLGLDGRYFVIACIDTQESKALHNIMKNKLKQAKKLFSELTVHAHEVKANEAYPCVKYHVLESIATKSISISYIVADLQHIESNLLKEKNILYNYLMKLLISKLIDDNDRNKKLNIICDNKTTKVASANSFSDYIKLYLNYECGYNIDVSVMYLDSDAGDAYIVQAVDYVANAIYTRYEYDNTIYSNCIEQKIRIRDRFPRDKFGK